MTTKVFVCVGVYVPHNGQLGRTDFPHNALSPQYIVGTYRCVCVCVCTKIIIVIQHSMTLLAHTTEMSPFLYKAGAYVTDNDLEQSFAVTVGLIVTADFVVRFL